MSQEDKEGFRFPIVNSKCINCGRCRANCPQNNPIHKNKEKESYAAFSLCEKVRIQSSTGGICYELSKCVLNGGGAVCGAVYDENLYVKHKIVKDKKDIYRLMVSKYMQSDMQNVYTQVAKELLDGVKLLFCGTPCQVHALKTYLNLLHIKGDIITVDLLCFGIPSPKAAHKYIRDIESKYNKRVVSVTLKDKTYGWHDQKSKYAFEDGTYIVIEDERKDYFAKSFLEHKFCIRRSCFECKYKTIDRVADITVGDFWGIKDTEMDDNKGTNAVIINSLQGRKLFQEIINNGAIKYKKCKIADILNGNPYVFQNVFTFDGEKRSYFWQLLEKESFETAVVLTENMK